MYTQAATVVEALAGAGFDVQATDALIPNRETRIRNGMVIGLTTVREGKDVQDVPIPHETVYRYDGNLSDGARVVTQAGADGYVRKEYLVKQINGLEVSRQPLGETMVQTTSQIVTIGTATATPEPTSFGGTAPDGGQCAKTVTVWSTYYTAASAGGSRTATGTGVYKGIVAVDPRVIPLRTNLYVEGYGLGLAGDTGGGIKRLHIDLGYDDDNYIGWHHYVDIYLLEPAPPPDRMPWVLP